MCIEMGEAPTPKSTIFKNLRKGKQTTEVGE